jgi:hypothetical protein
MRIDKFGIFCWSCEQVQRPHGCILKIVDGGTTMEALVFECNACHAEERTYRYFNQMAADPMEIN